MKKLLKTMILVATLSVVTASCKKEDCPVAPDFTGKWVGKYGIGPSEPLYDYTIFLNADGELGIIDGLGDTPTAKGTYTIIGNTMRGTYRYLTGGNSVYSIRANISGNEITDGTYGANEATSGSGKFIATKN